MDPFRSRHFLVLFNMVSLKDTWCSSNLLDMLNFNILKVQILSTKAQFWNRLFQRPQNDDLSRMRALLSQVTSRFNLNWKHLLLLEREVKSHPKKLLRVLKRLTFKRELKIQKKHLRGQPKSRSRNSWRLPWRASLLTQQTSVRFPQLESKLVLWNSSSMCLQQHRLPQMILMC